MRVWRHKKTKWQIKVTHQATVTATLHWHGIALHATATHWHHTAHNDRCTAITSCICHCDCHCQSVPTALSVSTVTVAVWSAMTCNFGITVDTVWVDSYSSCQPVSSHLFLYCCVNYLTVSHTIERIICMSLSNKGKEQTDVTLKVVTYVCHILANVTYICQHAKMWRTSITDSHVKCDTRLSHQKDTKNVTDVICQNVMYICHIWSVTPICHFPLLLRNFSIFRSDLKWQSLWHIVHC